RRGSMRKPQNSPRCRGEARRDWRLETGGWRLEAGDGRREATVCATRAAGIEGARLPASPTDLLFGKLALSPPWPVGHAGGPCRRAIWFSQAREAFRLRAQPERWA